MKYAGIYYCDIANGEGVRTTLFVSGCKFHCKDCFNQKYQDFDYGENYTSEIKNKILEHIKLPYMSGLSILGGDPLWQNKKGLYQLIELCDEVHKIQSKNVWLWSGFTWEQIFPIIQTDDLDSIRILRQTLIKNVDIFVDGQFVVDQKDMRLKWRGSSNQRVIDVKQSILNNKVVLYTN